MSEREQLLEQAVRIATLLNCPQELRDSKFYMIGWRRAIDWGFVTYPTSDNTKRLVARIKWFFRRLAGGEVFYRNFWIGIASVSYSSQFDYWWQHEDFDGEGDSRCGYAASIEACKAEIDNWYEENE